MNAARQIGFSMTEAYVNDSGRLIVVDGKDLHREHELVACSQSFMLGVIHASAMASTRVCANEVSWKSEAEEIREGA